MQLRMRRDAAHIVHIFIVDIKSTLSCMYIRQYLLLAQCKIVN